MKRIRDLAGGRRRAVGLPAVPLLLAMLFLPTPLPAQVGAIGVAAASGLTDTNAHEGAPILTENGIGLPAGAWSLSFYSGVTTGSFVAFDFSGQPHEMDYDVWQTVVGGFYALSDEVTVGVILSPFNRWELKNGASEDDSGFGDASLYGKYRLWRSDDGRTSLAGIGQLGLPVGQADKGFGSEGLILAVGGAVSRALDGGSLHASAALVIPTDDLDGDTTFRLAGAGVLGVSDRVGLSGELMAAFGSGEHSIDLAPGARIRLGQRTFLDAAFLFNVDASFDTYDTAFVLGLNVGG